MKQGAAAAVSGSTQAGGARRGLYGVACLFLLALAGSGAPAFGLIAVLSLAIASIASKSSPRALRAHVAKQIKDAGRAVKRAHTFVRERDARPRTQICAATCGTLAVAFVALTAAPSAYAACPNEALRQQNNSTALPDCRAYEQVSPVEKGGFSAYPESSPPAQNSPDGEKVSYNGYSSFPGAQGNVAAIATHLSTRTPGGWQTAELAPPIPNPQAEQLYAFFEGYDFSENLTQAVLKVPNDPLTPGTTPNAYNLFLRHPDGSYSLINNALPKVSAEEVFGPGLRWVAWQFFNTPAFAGASTDFSHVLFESNAQLTPEAPEALFTESLYENSGGQVRLVGYLPDGHPASTSTAGSGSSSANLSTETEADRRVEHAISADGARVVFQAPSDEGLTPAETGQNEMTEVYDRIEGSETIELSAPNAGATPENPAAAPATFWAASKDGSRVFSTSAAELTTQSKTGDEGGEDLYEYDFAKPAGERLTDLTPEAGAHGARVLGVVNPSADGSYVYFVAKGLLDGTEGTEGQPNLYMSREDGPPVFVATLSGAGGCDYRISDQYFDSCDWTPFATSLQAYVTLDGRHLAFMSTESLPSANFPSGYDNTDQKTGEPDSEVYEWSAETGELLCGSCDPSGEPPLGPALIGGVSQTRPGHRATIGSPFYRPPALNLNGSRLFYASPAPHAGASYRVFEYERSGAGSCVDAAGCQYPISNLGGEGQERFLGASADGKDVFFATQSRLVPGDEDNLIDVYDARVEGGFAPPSHPPSCEGEGCRGSASSQPASPSPGTGQFAGAEEGPKHPKCAKGQVKRHGRCVSRKHAKKKAHKKSNKRAASANRGGVK